MILALADTAAMDRFNRFQIREAQKLRMKTTKSRLPVTGSAALTPKLVHNLADDLENATDLNLDLVPLLDLNRFEATKTTVTMRKDFLTVYGEVAKRRGCSIEILINSALAEWLDSTWYQDREPRTFQEIGKRIAIDVFMNSNDDQLLYYYFLGIFGPPATLGDDNYWSDPPLPEWQCEILAKYRNC